MTDRTETTTDRRTRRRRGLRLRRRADGPLLALRVTAAIAALVIAAGLVTRFTVLLGTTSPDVRNRVAPDGSLTLALDTDDALYTERNWFPGSRRTVCTAVRTGGDADPGPLRVQLTGGAGDPVLRAATRLRVEAGIDPASDCSGFQRRSLVLDDTLEDALGAHGRVQDAASTHDPGEGVTTTWLRAAAWLPHGTGDTVQGTAVEDVSVVVTALAEPGRPPWLRTSLLVLGAFAQDGLLPLLVVLAACVVFLGVQNRIDRRERKLVHATAAVDGDVVFVPRERLG
jgi:hypothetical protein